MDREDEKKYTLDEYNWHIINNLREFNDKPNMIKDLYDKMRYNLPEHTILSKFYDIYETGLKYYDEHSTFPDIKWFEVNYAKSGKLKRTNDEFSIQVYEDCVKKVDMEIIKLDCTSLVNTVAPDISDVRTLKAKLSDYCDNAAAMPIKKKTDIISIYDSYSEDYDGVSTGIRLLDSQIGVLGHKSISVFGAPSGHGKSTFAVSVAYNAAVRQGKLIDYISYEVPAEHIWFNLVSMHSKYTRPEGERIESSKLKENAYKNIPEKKALVREVTADLLLALKASGGYINILDQTSAAVRDFDSLLARLESIATDRRDGENKIDRKADLIIVDNVDNFQVLQSKEKDEMVRVNNYIVTLDAFCKQYHHGDGCAILLLTQLNRQGMKTLSRASAAKDTDDDNTKVDVSVFQRYNALYEKGTCCLVGYAGPELRATNNMKIYPVKLRNRAVPEKPVILYADFAHSIIGGDGDEESKRKDRDDFGEEAKDLSGVKLKANVSFDEVDDFSMDDMEEYNDY